MLAATTACECPCPLLIVWLHQRGTRFGQLHTLILSIRYIHQASATFDLATGVGTLYLNGQLQGTETVGVCDVHQRIGFSCALNFLHR